MLQKLKAIFLGDRLRLQLPKESVEEVLGKSMRYRAKWTCTGPCALREEGPNCLKIRCKDDRPSGVSNFVVDRDPKSPRFGHATLQSHLLNWNGMAEERGWETNPVMCPNCIKARG